MSTNTTQNKEQFKALRYSLNEVRKNGKRVEKMQREFAYEYARILKDLIKNQTANVEPLAQSTKDRKKRQGKDLRIWIESGEAVKGIKAFRLGKGWFGGADPRLIHKGSKMRLVELLAYQEFGTSTIPPRPIFAIAKERIKEYIRKRYKSLYTGNEE